MTAPVKIEIGETYDATFSPKRTDDLREPCPKIGGRIRVQAMFIFLAHEAFPGEWCMLPISNDYPFWIPSGDLTDVALVVLS